MSRPVRVLAFGWYGAGNVGDELLLRTLKQWCAEKDAHVTALSIDPTNTGRIHQIDTIDVHDLPAVARAMQQSDLFVLGGGGLFQTHYDFTIPALYSYSFGDISAYARPALMAHQMGVPTLLWAQGVGPLDGADAQQIVKDLFANASRVSVRDESSRALLSNIGVDRDVVVAPDPVWAYPVPGVDERGARSTGRLAMVLRPWPFASGWEDAFIEALKETVPPDAHTLVWFPFQPLDVPLRSASDTPFIESLMQRLGGAYRQELVDLQDPSGVVQALAACDKVAGMRLHAQILSLKLRKPTLCLEYDQKMSSVSEMAGVPGELRLMVDSPKDAWRSAFAAWMASEGPQDDAVVQRLDRLSSEALRHRDVLHAAIEEAAARPRSTQWQAQDFDWLRAWGDVVLHGAVTERDGRIVGLQQSLAERDSELVGLQQSLAERDSQLETLAQSLGERNSRIDTLEQSVGEQGSIIDALQQSLIERDALVSGLRHDVAVHLDSLRSLDARAGQLQAQLTSAGHQLALKEQELAVARSDGEMLLRDRSALMQRESRLKAELGAIESSLSWRMTHPLRFAKALIVLPRAQRRELVYSATRSLYWSLPEPLRHALSGLRHRVVPRLRQGQPIAPTSSVAEMSYAFDWVGLANASAKVAIVPSAFEFDELANQRPINLAKYLAANGFTVIFAAWQWSRGESLMKSGTQVHPGVWQVDLYDMVDRVGSLDARKDGDSLYFITLPAPVLVLAHRELRQRGLSIVYDILDEWEEFARVGQAPWFTAGAEREAVLVADAVTAVSPPLAEKFADLRTDIQVIGNGYSPAVLGLEHSLCARNARQAGMPVRIGYFGHLTDAWFDWETVLSAARQMPDTTFEIIGYGEPEWVREAATQLPNLRLLGKVQPSELWRHAQFWHVALAPFKPGPLASAIDPIKVYEYLYLGLPVVCTGIPHLCSFPSLRVVDGPDALVRACRELAGATPDYAAMQDSLSHATWQGRFDALIDAVQPNGLRSLYAE